MAGRESLITQEIVDGIVLAVRTGAPLKVCAAAHGISETALYDWLAAGSGRPSKVTPGPLHAELAERVGKAKAEAHLMAVGTIRTAIARGNWQASLAWIRMRYPKHYSERVEVSGPGGGPIAFEIAAALEGLTEEELASIEAHIASSGDPEPTRRGRARKTEKGPAV